MPPSFFALAGSERREILQTAAQQSGHRADLLAKDIWVVWTLEQVFARPFADSLTFTGGTSLSKVYRSIHRFSEDIDLTYDIRARIPDVVGMGGERLAATRGKSKDVTDAVDDRLAIWIEREVEAPLAKAAATRDVVKVNPPCRFQTDARG